MSAQQPPQINYQEPPLVHIIEASCDLKGHRFDVLLLF